MIYKVRIPTVDNKVPTVLVQREKSQWNLEKKNLEGGKFSLSYDLRYFGNEKKSIEVIYGTLS